MAIVAILIGSTLGLVTGLIGFLFLGISLTNAVGLYLLSGVGIGMLTTGYNVALCVLSSRNQATAA
ncbi:hypothetical protein [Pelagimonas varians]|uniref:Uncharacterized protein n=1 Tax=Pelagimonas varians TaxID=696760 RepID=A0A238K9G4_9RHOB|nr:hypothetical protein [Pelagimonas varians]PYG31057.1 hypothetical protein C8N36_105114 [Pelagimonas varians]SMX39550.1 hypothetical protein PEV8663_01754 [Pelagimonas varians]